MQRTNLEGAAGQGSDRYARLFRKALLIRLIEEKIIELYPFDKIQSPVHLSIGQEAVAAQPRCQRRLNVDPLCRKVAEVNLTQLAAV